MPDEKGYRNTKIPGTSEQRPPGSEPILGHELQDRTHKVTESNITGTQKECRSVQWGTQTQRTHSREGETGHNVPLYGITGDTQRPQTVYTKLQWMAQLAVHYPERIFTSIAHLIDVDFLREAYQFTRKDGAPGLDGITAKDYERNLHENLCNLYERLKKGTYKAPPVKRAWLDKEDGSKRAIGIPEFEDKVVQRAVVMLLSAIYERMFFPFSYGFRERKSPHQAIQHLRESCLRLGINWIVDADICGFFDNLDKKHLYNLIKQRVNDGAILRLIGKWLNAGVVDGNSLYYPDKGTPQGGVVSPMLANIYLHYVLDEWFVKEVQPHLKGRSFIIRFADDFIIGCESQEDAFGLMEIIKLRFAQFGLTIHPEKSSVIRFSNPGRDKEPGNGKGTFDFLGFTHYWAKSLQGYWVIKRKTSRKRVKRTMKRMWLWCRNNRHEPIKKQYKTICQKLRGHFQYYAIRCNYQALEKVLDFVQRAWRFWLNRRGGKSFTWEKFNNILETFPLPQPKIIHNF